MSETLVKSGLTALLKALWQHVSFRRRRQFILLTCLVVVSAFAEIVSLGALLPFISVLISPEKVFNQPVIAGFVRTWGITSADQLILPLTLAFVTAALVAGAVRILLLWTSTRLAYAAGSDFCVDAYRRTLYQPYDIHVARNSSEIISGITNKVADTVSILNQLLTFISSLFLLVAITVTLIVVDPLVATVAAMGFGAAYALLSVVSRQQLRRNSERIAYEQTQLVKALQEGLGGIRDVLLDGTQQVYCDIYSQAERALRRAQGNNTFVGGSPRYAMEALGMVLIAALAYGISRQPGGFANALPVLGTLALGAQRLLPTLQQGYSAWSIIAGGHASLSKTVELLDQPLPPEASQSAVPSLQFQASACFENLRFRYSQNGPWVLDGLDLTIHKGSRVGIVGSTGSGKSTAADLLMALLMPTEGKFCVDNEPISGSRVRAWQMAIAHVPQSIFLADSSVAENVAFGITRDAIDFERLKSAACQAHIDEFIESLPEGYNTNVGERGVRLSGGQRQRIGIARALYKQASLLIFDEATSALDNATEQSVMDAIEGLNRNLTIVLIAHRLTTVRRCDTIIELSQGRVVAQGSYEHLIECSPTFRNLAKLTA